MNTYLTGLNDAGDFVGYASDMNNVFTGFASISGVITTFSVSGNSTFPQAINNLGQVAGYYGSGGGSGFFRDASGALTFPINFPGTVTFSSIFGLNDRGLMSGTYGTVDSASTASPCKTSPTLPPTIIPTPCPSPFSTGSTTAALSPAFTKTPAIGEIHVFIARYGR